MDVSLLSWSSWDGEDWEGFVCMHKKQDSQFGLEMMSLEVRAEAQAGDTCWRRLIQPRRHCLLGRQEVKGLKSGCKSTSGLGRGEKAAGLGGGSPCCRAEYGGDSQAMV